MVENNTLGDRLRKARNDAGLTQQELSKRSGVSQQAISNIEAGRRTKVRAETTTKLGSALKQDLLNTQFSRSDRLQNQANWAHLMETLEFETAIAERYPIIKLLQVKELQDLTDLLDSQAGRECVTEIIKLKQVGQSRLAMAAKILRTLVES